LDVFIFEIEALNAIAFLLFIFTPLILRDRGFLLNAGWKNRPTVLFSHCCF